MCIHVYVYVYIYIYIYMYIVVLVYYIWCVDSMYYIISYCMIS